VAFTRSEASDGPPKWQPVAVLPRHFAQFFSKTGLVVNGALDADVWTKTKAWAKNREEMATMHWGTFTLDLV
jgi:hypothetical protein